VLHNVLLIGGLALLLVTASNYHLLWLLVPLAVWQIAGVVWRVRARSGWRRPALLSGGAVLLAALAPALWLVNLAINFSDE